LEYTGAPKVSIISHSMGVTLGRRVIKGGIVTAALIPFNLGAPLTKRVDTFVGIAAADLGLADCYLMPEIPTCNPLNGFYPGYAIGPLGLSTYLYDLNEDKHREGQHVFSICSTCDELIKYGDIVWG